MKKRILSAILCLAMVATMLITPIAAAGVDLTADTITWNDSSSLKIATSLNGGHYTSISLGGSYTETSTISFWMMIDAETGALQNGFPIRLMNTIGNVYDTTTLGGIYPSIADGTNPGWTTDSTMSDWTHGGRPAYTAQGKWYRVDMVVDFEAKTFTAYVGGINCGTTTIPENITSYSHLNIAYVRSTAYKYMYVDNLMITKGANAPADGDLFATLTSKSLKAAKENVLFFEPYDTAVISSDYKTADVYNAAQGYAGGAYASYGTYKNEIVTTQGVAKYIPNIEIDNNSSLLVRCQNSGGKTIIYFGDVSTSATVTWYTKTNAVYADYADALWYQLYSGDTFLGGFVSAKHTNNPTVHLNTTQAGQPHNWGGTQKGTVEMDKWNRYDLVIDFANDTITGYLNYSNIQTLSFSEAGLDSFDRLVMSAGWSQWQKGVQLDNLMVREGAQAPSRSDVAANVAGTKIAVAEDVLLYMPMNVDTPIVHGTNVAEFKAGTVYNYRTDANSGMSGFSNTVGMTPQTKDFAYQGHQDTLAAGGEDFAVRFVGTVLDYEKVYGMGFDIKLNDGTVKEFICANVYDKLLGSANGVNVEYSAIGDFQTGNIYALTLTGLALDQTYAFEVTPFTYDLDGETKNIGETYTVTYVNGVLQ